MDNALCSCDASSLSFACKGGMDTMKAQQGTNCLSHSNTLQVLSSQFIPYDNWKPYITIKQWLENCVCEVPWWHQSFTPRVCI